MKRGKVHYDWSTGWVRGYVRLGKRASTGGRIVKLPTPRELLGKLIGGRS